MRKTNLTFQIRSLAIFLCSFLLPSAALAAPEAHILRIDPRAMQDSGDPLITTVVEVVQSKRVSEVTASCATLTGNAQLDCMSTALEKPNALYTPFSFPEKNAKLTVLVDGTDSLAKYVSDAKWGASSQLPGVGTAWLILIDADRRMGSSFEDAKQLAGRFVTSMGPNDIVNIMFFNDRQVVLDSKWLAASAKSKAQSFVSSVNGTFASQGRNRTLLTIIKGAATDGFKALGNSGQDVKVPMHQAMVVLSDGFGGTDPSTTGPGAVQLSQYLTGGRFPEDNTALPKTPVPVISVYFPQNTLDEFRMNSLDFMQNLANPEIGGFFTVMQAGGSGHSDDIVKAVRTRFSKMDIVRWRVSCVAPTVTQSFKLIFTNTDPPIAGDSTFKDVPVGIDPSTWPLDLNVQYTKDSNGDGVYPGGHFKVYGDFCWGGDKSRAEVYFLPAGQQIPSDLAGADLDKAKETQQQLIQMGMRGTTLEAADAFAEFEAPDKDKIIHGSGSQGTVQIVIYDNKAHRTSGITADTVLQLKGTQAPFPLLLVLGIALVFVVIAIVVIVVLRGSNTKKRSPAPQPAPVVAGGYAPRPSPGVMGTASRATLHGAVGSFTISPGVEMRVGRDARECAITISDPLVSSVHAMLKLENGNLYVRDEGSSNGTFINGTPIVARTLNLVPGGAQLRFGPVELSVRLD